jgi:hypothetical protein
MKLILDSGIQSDFQTPAEKSSLGAFSSHSKTVTDKCAGLMPNHFESVNNSYDHFMESSLK